ncbi:SGNH/GDSL hydrolase family protein [Streptomyces physcomitrii]|uniref:SGNH/GDSL hydrolase family protein n=1 Tax=Streptomyces physcomitrii TaxID=2724184 RepID=UPI0028A7AD59|nr:SGNH/GDSL hydrolase family protein [Streptomyces physcomitrii]
MRPRLWTTAAVLACFLALPPWPPGTARAESAATGQPLERLYDNTAVGVDGRPSGAGFDGAGNALSAGDLAAAGWTPGRTLTLGGATFTLPRYAPGRPDNLVADGQRVRLTGRGSSLALLVAATGGPATGTGTLRYRDGSRQSFTLGAPDWRTGPLGSKAVALPHVNSPGGQLTEQAKLYTVSVPLERRRALASVELPRDNGPDLHVFAASVQSESPDWSGSWAAATSGQPAVGPWADRSLRLVVHTSAGGPRVRVRLDNTFASAPVDIGGASVAVQESGATAASDPRPLRFGGATGTRIAAGAQALSDPLDFEVPADSNLLVSFHLPGTVASAPLHQLAVQESYLSEGGDHTAERTGEAYTGTLTNWPLLAGVDVGGGPGSVVVLGDSITDGERTTAGANRRWPDLLADRLRGQREVPRYGVLNQGISANRVLSDRYPGDGVSTDTGGVSALNRLERDVLAQTSARTVILFMGVNDVRWGARADQVSAGLREIAARTRARGLKVLAATIAPCQGESRCTAQVEAERAAVNAELRTGAGFDAVLDFDAVLRDPANQARLAPAYDSGDHLHPSEAGLAALADSVELGLLRN